MSEMSAGRSLAYYAAEVGLTPKQRAFAEALISDPKRNKGLAAKKAGYASPVVTGSQMAKHPKVLQYIRLIDAKANQEAEEEASEAKKSAGSAIKKVKDLKVMLSEIASGNMWQYTDQEGSLDLARVKAEDKGYLVKRMSKGGMAEPTDALAAITKLGEHYKMFDSKQQQAPQLNFMHVVQHMAPDERKALSSGLDFLYRAMLSTGQVVDVEAEEV